MGIIKQGILGGLSGKVGNVVGSSWKGIHYLRSLPSHVANPRTIAQQTSRKKMDLVIRFLKTLTGFIRIGFSGYAVKMSAFNAATSLNLGLGIAGSYPDLQLDYENLQVSRGNLEGAAGAAVGCTEPGVVDFTWFDNSGTGNATGTDQVMLVIYNPAKNSSVYRTGNETRQSQEALVDEPAINSGDEVHCYISFSKPDRMFNSQLKDCISNSVYAGTAVVL